MLIKKRLIICLWMTLAVGLILSGCSSKEDTNIPEGDTHPYIGTKTLKLRPTDTAPQIDGKKDASYKKSGSKISLDEFNKEYWEHSPENESAVIYVTYDREYLYLYAEVSDKEMDHNSSNILNKDNIAVFLDFDYIRQKVDYTNYFTNKIGYVTAACDNTYTYDYAYQEQKYYSQLACASLVDEKADKYIIEMRLPFLDGFTGEHIGFEVMNTDCSEGKPIGVRTWNIDGSQMTQYAHCAGTLEFETNLWQPQE